MSAMPAAADTLTFNTQDPTLYFGGDTLSEGAYSLLVNDLSGAGLAGAIVDGSDANRCDIIACPASSSHYYAGLNNSSVTLSRGDSALFKLGSLDYAFVAPTPTLGAYSYGELTLVGTLASGATVSTSIAFPALEGGYSPFAASALSAGFSGNFYSSITISACVYSGGACVGGGSNLAQFAIDNVNVTAVPEPESYAMFGLGLGVLALVRRRTAVKSA
jgi:hypothetical protein